MSDNNVNHVYDGIVEENNSMPRWWVWLFILTVIFSVIYWIHYNLGGAPTLADEYNSAMQAYEKQLEVAASKETVETEESLIEYFKNQSAQLAGAKVFAEKCAMCHGEHLEGKIGPNLTDNFWLHGNKAMDLVKVVNEGVPAKGMPPWTGLLKPLEVKNTLAFIYSKIGSNPANPKAPEGVEIK